MLCILMIAFYYLISTWKVINKNMYLYKKIVYKMIIELL